MIRKLCAAIVMLPLLAAAPRRDDADIIVVGAGLAGLSAALEAASHHASVIVVDASSVFGGHAVMSGGHVAIVATPMQRARGIHDSPALAARDFVSWGGDPDRAWVSLYARTSKHEIYDWLTSMGVRFDDVIQYAGNSVPRQHVTHDAGFGLVAPVYRRCLRTGVRFLWLTKVNTLTKHGVRATNLRTGEPIELRARAVILATGGFQSNTGLVLANWPKALPKPERILAGSGINSTGSGLELARAAGAKLVRLDHQWNYETGIPDPRYPNANRGLNASSPGGMWINRNGERFVDESLPRPQRLAAVLRQPGGTYWQVFDAEQRKEFFVSGTGWNRAAVERLLDQVAKSGMTTAELARKCGLPSIPKGSLKTPPFYAVQFFPLARKSMGGIAVDIDARVIGVPHLYAAGEATGFGGINGSAALEGTFLGPCIVMGRIAARSATASLTSHVALETQTAPELPPASEPCTQCHELTSSNPARWHFVRVHAEAKECRSCHTTHRIDRIAQINVCVKCHANVSE